MASSAARSRGFAVNEKIAQYQVKAVVATFKPATADMASGKPNIPDPAVSVSYALVGLAAEGYAPDATTAAMAHRFLQQDADGSLALPARPPIESSMFTSTALSCGHCRCTEECGWKRARRARGWRRRCLTPRKTGRCNYSG
jgi:hypothetical protein